MRLKQDQQCFTCEHCGSIQVPPANEDGIRVFDVPGTSSCPICICALVYASTAGERILFCKTCHGMLISMAVFQEVILDLKGRRENVGYIAPPFESRDLDRRIACPQCSRPMVTHLYGGGGNVVIDNCERCGVNWLDYGELDRIVRAPDQTYAG